MSFNFLKTLLLSSVLVLPVMSIANKAQAESNALPAAGAEPLPLEYWAVRSALNNVQVSPDGKYVSFMKINSKKGNPIVEIYDASDLSKEPIRFNAGKLEITGYSWISEEEMTVSFRGQVSKKIKGFNRGAYKNKFALYSVESQKFTELSNDNLAINLVNVLPDEKDTVLVTYNEFKEGQSFRTPSYYKMNVKTKSKTLALKGVQGRGGYRFDAQGNPRFSSTFDRAAEERIFSFRKLGESKWEEYYRQSVNDWETFQYAGFVEGNDDQIYVIANNGQDKTALWRYNLSTKSFGQKVYDNKDVDIQSTLRHTNSWENPGLVTGVSYFKDKIHRHYFDKSEEAMMKQFEAVVPNVHFTSVTSRSKDGNTMVIRNIGPKDPGTFYLFNKGKFKKLGSVNGLLKSSDLSDLEYITYTARDGKKIPGFITKPKGAGPHPLVVMPHGGPFIGEVIVYDEWAQLLANNGYMVLQPQYRGSKNYGLDFYKTAFIDGGEGGAKMQDDKDDGVKHLIKKGLVDPDRVAMFGWSYGGYAALIAASRPDNIYQCVIAGAAVADNEQQVNYYGDSLRGIQKVEQLNFWNDSVNPIKEVENVNVPLLLVHGSIDQRVPIKHAEKYKKALEKAGKEHKYLKLKDADHFSNTLFYDHKIKFYPEMIDYLKNDCGPNGL